MSVNTTLAGLSQSAGANGPDGTSDAPSSLDDAIRYALSFIAQIRDGAHEYATSIAGSNTITGTIATNPTAYVTGREYRFVAAAANTGAATLNLNSLGAKAITKNGAAALTGGEIQSGEAVTVVYDGTQFQLQAVTQPAVLAGSGYQRLSSGLILQWGLVTAARSGSGDVYSHSIAFPNAALAATAIHAGTDATVNIVVRALSTTSIELGSSYASASVNCYYIALGY